MIPLHFIVIFFFFLLLLLPRASTYATTEKPGCPAWCGNVWIPYPFGVGSDCSLDASFNITCDTSTFPHKPYLNISSETVQVIQIRLNDPPQIRVKYPYLLAAACYNISLDNNTQHTWNSIDLEETPYTVSEDNWLIVIGCDDFAAATKFIGENGFRDACIGYSWHPNSTDKGTCPKNSHGNSVGDGCCRIPITKGTSYVHTNLVDMSKSWNRSRIFPCSYAFVKEKGKPSQVGYEYNFYVLQRNSTQFLQSTNNLPVVQLDWHVGAENCSKARRHSSFVCKENSDCVDFGADIGGYLCNWSQGYHGNPYLGCQDINECDTNPCAQHSHCINNLGSYECKCRKGYTGDGKSGGTGCLGSTLGLLLLYLFWSWLRKALQKRHKRKHKEHLFNHLLLLQQQTSQDTFGKTKLFTAKELEKATDNFNDIRICGLGSQGTVYKGMLFDGTIVAIKKLKQVDDNQVEQFINEVDILSQINHKNVVKFLGCCLATEAPLLVYEFLPSGTLFDLIRDRNAEFPLTWNMRLNIASGIAGAVAYLHSACSIPIYHRDIKSTNILLDEKNIVKVTDFGISKFVGVDQTHLTTMVKGTIGYLDPKYFQTGKYTEKSDVYSFGVVLVELLTGQRPIHLERSEVQGNLATLFLACMEANNLESILDSQVVDQGEREDILAVARLARRCLNFHGKMRPTMKEVATELERLRMSQMPSSIVNDEVEEAKTREAKSMMMSDIEYTWTFSDVSIVASSSEEHPLTSAGV